MSIPTETPEFVLRGGKAIRFVEKAIYHRLGWLAETIATSNDENAIADASNDFGFYQAILSDIKAAREV